jgi:hypothetical protein
MCNTNTIQEPSREIAVSGKFDVIVIGGGIAGVAAAVAAARNSVRVCLIERYCGLGGLATLGNVTMWLPLCDGMGNQVIAGLGEELLKLSVADLKRDNPSAQFRGVPACWQPGGNRQERTRMRYQADFNPAAYMLAIEELVVKAGVKLFYDTRFCSVRREGVRVSHVIVENKGGRSALACGVVIDTTGDADVCVAAGESTLSLESNVPAGWFYTLRAGELKLHHLSNAYCPVASIEGGQAPFFGGDDAEQVTAHILQTRKKVRERLRIVRAEHTADDVQLLMPATTACFRMTRRLVGRFTLAEKHVHQWFDDTIGLTGDWRRSGPVYAIPYSCLRGVQTSNLLVAGRCISVDNTAWDVLRAIPPCVVTGEAAGTAAALAAAQAYGDVGSVDYHILQDRLLAQDVLLDSKLVATLRKDMNLMDKTPNKVVGGTA